MTNTNKGSISTLMQTPEAQEYPAKITKLPENRLYLLRERYEGAMDDPVFYTREFQTRFWRDMYSDDTSILVAECNLSQEALQKPMVDLSGNPVTSGFVFVPETLAGRQGLLRLSQRSSSLQDYIKQGGKTALDTHTSTGYVKVEAEPSAPNTDTKEEDLAEHLETHRSYRGQRVVTNILLSQALFVLRGRFSDVGTVSRLPGSTNRGFMVNVGHSSGGYVSLDYNLEPQFQHQVLGARFEEVYD